MTSHYFTPRQEGPESFFSFPLEFGGATYQWWSAHGVFAKDQLDFGSRFLLETAVLPREGRLLDVGCGTGALGLLAAVGRPDVWVCLSDVTERALACAGKNRLGLGLGLAARSALVHASFLDAFKPGSFRAVLFNPPFRVGKAAVLDALADMPRILEPGGCLWVVVRVQQGARSYLAHLERVFEGDAEVVAKRKGYLVLRAASPAADDRKAAHRGAGAGGSFLLASGTATTPPPEIRT